MRSYETITSLQNPLVKRLVRLKNSKQDRDKEKVTIVEGGNLIEDLLRYKTPEALFVTEKFIQRKTLPAKQLFLISPEVMGKISTVESPEGILALFPIEENVLERVQFPALILDGLQDPGNVGTLLRTASSFGLQNLILIEPCCDLWHPKVMRAAKGAHYFFSSIVKSDWKKIVSFCEKKGASILAASLDGIRLKDVEVPQQWALVLGSEAKGLSIPKSVKVLSFTIPIEPHMDSLNVAQAGAIAMYALLNR